MKLIDLHCDTAMKMMEDPTQHLAKNSLSIDLEKLAQAESMAQVFAIFIDLETIKESPIKAGFAMLDHFWKELEQNADKIKFAANGGEIRTNEMQGKKSALLAIEEGAVLEGQMGNLHGFYRQGVRFITLTWNYPNEIGFPHGKEHGAKGLTPFGLEVVEEMNRIGMMVDVSHLSEGGFWDVCKNSKTPFMATHSNCQALKDHTRNLTDDQIRGLAEKGGVMGISVVKNFLMEGEDDGRLEAMVNHIRHAHKVGGIDVVSIGTDFDGTSTNHEFSTIGDLQKLTKRLQEVGYSEDELEKIYWRNALRVINQVLT
jgi:Zn-dependent dipeptidase, microsomal dipeptidase homolog